MRREPRGFTLIELMVVVAILAILSTLAVVYMRSAPKPIDAAQRFAAMASEASRLAVQYGPLRSDVAEAQGKSRTRILATSGTNVQFVLYLVEEDPAPATTVVLTPMQWYTVPKTITSDAFANSVGTYASVTTVTNWSTFQLACYPNGTCDGRTLFFSQGVGSTLDRQARVSILPIGAGGHVVRGWN